MQGIVGNIPWSAMVFLTLYFQLMGMNDFSASLVVSLFFGATAVGGLIGGWLGDRAAKSYPNHGRIAVTQFSVALGPIFALVVLKVRLSVRVRLACVTLGIQCCCSGTLHVYAFSGSNGILGKGVNNV